MKLNKAAYKVELEQLISSFCCKSVLCITIAVFDLQIDILTNFLWLFRIIKSRIMMDLTNMV